MSKAFTKEVDDTVEQPVRKRGVAVAEGVPNYLTPRGARALRAELAACEDADRARELADHLATAVVMDAPEDRTRVGFGAIVTVENEHGERTRYRLVGAIEAAPREGAIYFLSPIAEALHDARVGDEVTLPRGDVTVVAIEYDA